MISARAAGRLDSSDYSRIDSKSKGIAAFPSEPLGSPVNPHDVVMVKWRILGAAVSGDSPAESRMRGDLHVRFGGRGYPDPTIIMPLQCYLVQLYL
jgi:hypothetical protein